MKTSLTQWRIKARKASACGLCKPWKQGWADKKTVRDIRHAQRAQQQLAEISQCRRAERVPPFQLLKIWRGSHRANLQASFPPAVRAAVAKYGAGENWTLANMVDTAGHRCL